GSLPSARRRSTRAGFEVVASVIPAFAGMTENRATSRTRKRTANVAQTSDNGRGMRSRCINQRKPDEPKTMDRRHQRGGGGTGARSRERARGADRGWGAKP